MKKKTLLIIVLGIGMILGGGWLIYQYKKASLTKCNFYRLVMTRECICPEGYKNLGGFTPYCATESQKPCKSHADCPKNERCISKDGETWFCSGRRAGCYHWNPENPEDAYCAD